MPKTHEFLENRLELPIIIVLDKIQTIQHDSRSECTTITMIGGEKIGVSESVEIVKKAVESA